MRTRYILLPAVLLLSGCALPTGDEDLTMYRDVFWRVVGIDGVMSHDWQYPLPLGTYVHEPQPGVQETCVVSGLLQTGAFGWVESANTGHVIRATPVPTQGPYDLFSVRVQALCGASTVAAWTFDGLVLVDAIAIKSQNVLEIRSIRAGPMMLNDDFVDADEAARWLDADLEGMPLADTMNVAVDFTVRAWDAGGTTQIGEWSRTVVLTYVREEAVYPRGTP